jgi:hypothetical protein
MWRGIRALALALTTTWLVAGQAAACLPPDEDADGSAVRALTQVATPMPVLAGVCDVTPRTAAGIREIQESWKGPHATPFSDLTLATDADLPDGEPVDPATLDAVTATLETFLACGNAGDLPRLFALFSDDFLASHPEDFPPEELESLAATTPSPTPYPVTIAPIEQARLLPDGRVVLIADFNNESDEPTTDRLMLWFVEERGRWAIDDLLPMGGATDPATPAAQIRTVWQIVQGDGYEGAIVSATDAPDFVRTFRGGEPSGYWTPTSSQIAQLEADLAMFVEPPECGESPVPERIRRELGSYGRQYAGFTEDGRDLILVNAFCDAHDVDWQNEPVFILDGGACYFQITYDPATGDFFDLSVNGEA